MFRINFVFIVFMLFSGFCISQNNLTIKTGKLFKSEKFDIIPFKGIGFYVDKISYIGTDEVTYYLVIEGYFSNETAIKKEEVEGLLEAMIYIRDTALFEDYGPNVSFNYQSPNDFNISITKTANTDWKFLLQVKKPLNVNASNIAFYKSDLPVFINNLQLALEIMNRK